MLQDKIFSMPAGAAFLPELAKGLERQFGERLPEALILLPTRRAVRELSDILIGKSGTKILPRIRPLADIDPDEPPFEPGYLANLVKPAMSPLHRRFELARLIGAMYRARGEDLDAASKLALADPLISILDDAAMEEVGLENLNALSEIQEFAARHFQDAAKFYEILQLMWPRFLDEIDAMEPMARRVALLNALTKLWEDNPPNHPVIIAGSTGTLAATARLMRCVSHMREGLIILPGLDKHMPSSAWQRIILDNRDGETATAEISQYSLKKLLSVLNVERKDIKDWENVTGNIARQSLISEALVPADSTSDWPERIDQLIRHSENSRFFEQALDGLSIIEARTDDEEAMAIALILREVIETPNKTGALITPDPTLARRVKAYLRRWHVNVDYSQGEPLEETARGSFLAIILRVAGEPHNMIHMAALMKHRLTHMGQKENNVLDQWNRFEKNKLRQDISRVKAAFDDEFIVNIFNVLAPLTKLPRRKIGDWVNSLCQVAEAMAATEDVSGASVLWREDAGEKASALIQDLLQFGYIFGEMELAEFAKLFGTLMRGKVVRPRYGTHPRLQILGPLEARMLSVDTLILGGLNEGVWPARPSIQPFLSRNMRQSLGLSLPERRLGLAAHDFQQLAASSRVILTRAQKSEEGPKVAARWLWRLQTLVKGALQNDYAHMLAPEKPYLEWARLLDGVEAEQVNPAPRPAPTPALEQRWPMGRKLSVTRIKSWVRDPYAIYARYILGLRPLEDIGRPIGPREYGNALHKGIELFTQAYKGRMHNLKAEKLKFLLEQSLLKHGFEPFHLARETVRLERIAHELTTWMTSRAADHALGLWSEIRGQWLLEDVSFTLTGQPDLIERSALGYTIVDYKTGHPPSTKVIKAGFDPQLPLLAAMISEGAFANYGAEIGSVADLLYVRVKGSESSGKKFRSIISPQSKDGLSSEEYQNRAVSDLKQLIKAFDKAETAYHSQPRIQYKDDYGDYDHLARRGEWAKLGLGV